MSFIIVMVCYIINGLGLKGGAIPPESSRYSSMRSRRASPSAELKRSWSAPRLSARATLSAIAACMHCATKSTGIVMETARCL